MEKEKLKTLKEIADFEQKKFEKETGLKLANGEMPLHLETIKAEAVKWVKYYFSIGQFHEAQSLIDFFNLTEEDLE